MKVTPQSVYASSSTVAIITFILTRLTQAMLQ